MTLILCLFMFCAGLIPYSMYTQWFNSGCDEPIFTAQCQRIMDAMNDVIGVNFDPDNLYTDLPLGQLSLL